MGGEGTGTTCHRFDTVHNLPTNGSSPSWADWPIALMAWWGRWRDSRSVVAGREGQVGSAHPGEARMCEG